MRKIEPVCQLSRDQLALLAAIADGDATDTVARRLGTSPRTVRRRLSEICGVLGVGTTIEAVASAARRGLI